MEIYSDSGALAHQAGPTSHSLEPRFTSGKNLDVFFFFGQKKLALQGSLISMISGDLLRCMATNNPLLEDQLLIVVLKAAGCSPFAFVVDAAEFTAHPTGYAAHFAQAQ